MPLGPTRPLPPGAAAGPPAATDAGRGVRLALVRLERAQDALRGLLADVEEAQALAHGGEPDAKLATVLDQLRVARHKLDLYVQAFAREHARELRGGERA
jgi:hypothetical protein